MDVLGSLEGMVSVELTCADPAAALRAISRQRIPLFDTEMTGPLQLRFRIRGKDWKKLRMLAKKRGQKIRLRRREGLFWLCKGLIKRPVLVLGMVFLIWFSLWIPGRIFFIRVEGNDKLDQTQIAEQARLCGIGFGASRKEVRSEKVKNALLDVMPQLQWAGVNTYGCVAVITVRERNDPPQQQPSAGVSSIVALRDGIVQEMTVLRGNGLCRPGQAIKAGQVLISGYTDCGLYIQATRAEGDVYAITQRELTVLCPSELWVRQEKTASEKRFSIIIGKKRINLSKGSGILGGSCAKIESDYNLTLPGGFQLPIRLVREEIISYEIRQLPSDSARQMLQAYARKYLLSQMIAGRIDSTGEVFMDLDGLCRMDGVYGCYEMIGTSRVEENMESWQK